MPDPVPPATGLADQCRTWDITRYAHSRLRLRASDLAAWRGVAMPRVNVHLPVWHGHAAGELAARDVHNPVAGIIAQHASFGGFQRHFARLI